MEFNEVLAKQDEIWIRQRFEVAELLGFETRNKYEIQNSAHQAIGYAAEQNKGIIGFLARQFLGHWRSFEISIFDLQRRPVLSARHPFRLLFQRVEVHCPQTGYLGALQQRFAIISKKFDVLDAQGRLIFAMRSPLWKIWSFPFYNASGNQVGVVQKRWGGLLAEGFTDKDSFNLRFENPQLSLAQRKLMLAAALFVDLQYFEAKADN